MNDDYQLNYVDIKTKDRDLEALMLEEYPGIIKENQYEKEKDEEGKSIFRFYCLDKDTLENFLQPYHSLDYEIYQESVDFATTSEFLYDKIKSCIGLFAKAGQPDNAEEYVVGADTQDTAEGTLDTADKEDSSYLILDLDRNVLVSFLEQYNDALDYEMIHSRSGIILSTSR